MTRYESSYVNARATGIAPVSHSAATRPSPIVRGLPTGSRVNVSSTRTVCAVLAGAEGAPRAACAHTGSAALRDRELAQLTFAVVAVGHCRPRGVAEDRGERRAVGVHDVRRHHGAEAPLHTGHDTARRVLRGDEALACVGPGSEHVNAEERRDVGT